MALSGGIDITQDRILTSGEKLTNPKVNEATTFTARVKAHSITTRELESAFAATYFDTKAAYDANTNSISNGTLVYLTGYYTANAADAGPPFKVDTSDTTTTADGFSCIVDANGLRAKRTLSDTVFASWAGCKGNGLKSSTASISSGDNTLTDTSDPFRSDHVGHTIIIPGAGAAGADLVTTIASYTDEGEVEITTAASTTVATVEIIWGTNDLTQIQVIEDYLYAAGGGDFHWNDNRVFLVSDFIQKKANVHWTGNGKIQRLPSANAHPLVKCHEINNWSIGNLRFENAVWNAISHTAGTIDDFNCCVSVTGCDDWVINDCEFRRYSGGIRVLKSDDWSIVNCDFDGETGETTAGMWAGTWSEPASYTGTGDIITYPAYSVASYSYDDDIANTGFIIDGNHCKSVGLDIGISLSEQVYESTPGVVSNNVIYGTRHGIAVYKGSNVDPGDSTTYSRHVNITGNHISYCFENGIYVRTDQGVLVANNLLYRNNKKGTYNSQTGGGIVFRVGVDDFGGVVSSTPTFDTGNMCVGNFVIDTGDPTNGTAANVNDGGIVVRTRYTYVYNNSIVNTEESGYSREGTGISALPGILDRGCEIKGNRVYNFLYGIYTAAQTHQDEGTDPWIVKDNVIERVQDGILFEPLMPDCILEGNFVRNHTGEGIKIRYAPRAKVLRNIIEDGVDGIHIAGGCFDTRINNRSTQRRGAGVHVIGNICSRLTGTTHKVSETGSTDATFYNRCAVLENEVVDGKPQWFINGRSGGNPVYSFAEGRVWHNGDKFYDSDGVSAGGVEGKICTDAGVYGTITPTGDTTNTTDQLTNISDMDDLFVGCIIDVAGVTGPLTITAIDPDNSSATIDPVADATTSGANITYHTPTFKDVGTIAV